MAAETSPTTDQIQVALHVVSLPLEFVNDELRTAAQGVLLKALQAEA